VPDWRGVYEQRLLQCPLFRLSRLSRVTGPQTASTGSSEAQKITLPWETWRAVIAILREKALPYMLEHANVIEELLEQHAPDAPTIRLSLTGDVCLRSSTWARVQLGIPLPVE
jgi:hypothetical protein